MLLDQSFGVLLHSHALFVHLEHVLTHLLNLLSAVLVLLSCVLDRSNSGVVNKIKRNAKAVAKDKKFRERIITEFGEDFYMDHAEELVYDAYLGVAGIAEILREEDEEYVRALKIVLGNSSKLKQAIAINRKRNG